MKSWILYMYSVSSLVEARATMDNIFLSHSYILVFRPKSLFSITLILICITLSLVTLLGNHFSFHFIALRCKRNVILPAPLPLVLCQQCRCTWSWVWQLKWPGSWTRLLDTWRLTLLGAGCNGKWLPERQKIAKDGTQFVNITKKIAAPYISVK